MTGFVTGSIGSAGKPDIPEIADLLARAFDNDPELRAFVDGKRRQHRLRSYLEAEARQNLDMGGIIDLYRSASGTVVAVAVWESPTARQTVLQTLRYGPSMLKAVGPRGLLNWLTCRSDFKRFRPGSPHWHLVRLVTDASARKQGIATALLSHRHDVIDRQGGGGSSGGVYTPKHQAV